MVSGAMIDIVPDGLDTAEPVTASQTATLAAEIAECESKTGQASDAAQAVALNVRMVSGMMNDLTHGLKDIIDKAGETQIQAATVATESAATRDSLTALMSSLDDVASSAELISDVARHTNILALNASIEAAHAGDHGGGFAIIAAEVRALSEQTTQATKCIHDQLGAIRVAAVRLGNSLEQVNASFATAHGLMDGIAATMRQQAESFAVVSSYTDDAATSAEQITATLDQAARLEQALAEKISRIDPPAPEDFADDTIETYETEF